MHSLHTVAACEHPWSFRCIGRAIYQLSTLATDCPFPILIFIDRVPSCQSSLLFIQSLLVWFTLLDPGGPRELQSVKTEERRHGASRALTLTAALGRLGVAPRATGAAERRLTIHVLGSLEEL